MSDQDEPLVSEQEAVELGSAAFFTAVGESAKIVVPAVAASAGWQAMLAVTLPLMGLAVARGAYRLFGPRTALLAKGYTKAFGDDPERVKKHAKEHEHDADYHETMYRTFRAMMDAAEPEVVETLGYMAGVYTSAGRKPDAFFRGLGRLLCDLEAGELAALVALMRAIEAGNEHGDEWLDLAIDGDLDAEKEKPYPSRRSSAMAEEVKSHEIVKIVLTANTARELGQHPLAWRFFGLFKRQGLAENKSPFVHGEPTRRFYPLGIKPC